MVLLVLVVLLYQADPRWAVSALMSVAAALELGGVACVVLEGRQRSRTIQAYLEHRRAPRSVKPLSTTAPFHPPASRYPLSTSQASRDIVVLQEQIEAIKFDIRNNLASRVNRAVADINETTTRGDLAIEEFVVAVTAGNRGRTRLGIALLLLGIVLAGVANLWSVLWLDEPKAGRQGTATTGSLPCPKEWAQYAGLLE